MMSHVWTAPDAPADPTSPEAVRAALVDMLHLLKPGGALFEPARASDEALRVMQTAAKALGWA